MPEQNHGFEGQDHHPDRRIDIAAARKMLGMIGKNYEDDEIAKILDQLYGIARDAYDAFQEEAEKTEE